MLCSSCRYFNETRMLPMPELATRKKLTATCGWCAAAAAVLAALALYTYSGAVLWQIPLVWLAAAAAIYLPGTLLLRAAKTRIAGPQRFLLCCVLGGTFFALLTVLACLTSLHWLMPAVTGALFVVWAAGWLKRLRTGESLPKLPADAPWLVLVCAVCVLLNALWSIRYTHPAATGSVIPSQDFFWNLGNVQSFLLGFPPEDLRVSGVIITYHYLTELLQAGFILLTGVPAYDMVAFAAYAPVAAGMIGCLYALGVQLWGGESRRALALGSLPLWLCCASLWKALEAGGSRFGNMLFIHVVSNINGQATALAALAAFLALFHRLEQALWREEWPVYAGGIAAFYLLTFSKGPQAALLALALTAALAVRLIVCGATRLTGGKNLPLHMPAAGQVLFYAVVCGGFWLVYGGLFSAGAGSSMSLSLTRTVELHFFGSILNAGKTVLGAVWPVLLPVVWLAQGFCMAPAAGLAFGAGALRDIRRLKELTVFDLTLYAAVPGGLLAFYLFDHYSSSQIYFATIAIVCLGILLLRELPALWAKRGWFGRLCRAAAAVLLAAGVATALCQTTYLVRSIPETRAAVTTQNKLPLTAAEEDGCLWLADNMPADALFATNRMHTGSALEGLSNVYSGLSGRRAYCESIKYALSNMGDQTGDIMQRYGQMEELFHPDTTPQRAYDICARYGITHVLYHPASPGSNASLRELPQVFLSDELIIYRVR